MKEFFTQHWLLVFALFMYAMGFINGYLNGKREHKQMPKAGSEDRMSKETTCENCIYANACIMYEPKMKRCKDYKESED